ncbi:MAG TPA: hypothetical protein VGJ04_01800 [Pirellulales bacterium]
MKEHQFLAEWSKWQPNEPPHQFPGDEDILAELGSKEKTRVFRSWEEYYQAPDFCEPGDTRLHLGLLPQPFIGNLRTAKVFVLMLNPGLNPNDYFAQYAQPGFRQAMLDNLAQRNVETFTFLDPQFAWCSGFRYWHSKFSKLIEALADNGGRSFSQARKEFSKWLATIELVPYHSRHFNIGSRYIKRMKSAELARSFVDEVVIPRAIAGECVIVVTRKVKQWDIPAGSNVIIYNNAEAQAAYITPHSRGGARILQFLTNLN